MQRDHVVFALFLACVVCRQPHLLCKAERCDIPTSIPHSLPGPAPQASERFLQHMVSLYVSSHYKNTPNDLILMSDAPAHHLFVLLGPVDESQVWAGCCSG